MMWLFLVIALAELLLVHLLVALWHPHIALGLSFVTLLSILWLVRMIVSLRRYPVVIGEQTVLFRLGRLREIAVPLDRVARLRTSWPRGFHKRRSVLNLALMNYPNVMVELHAPIAGRRGRDLWAIAHRLDDPIGFATALQPRIVRPESGDGQPQFWFG
jgi:hypothetical protein